MDKDWLKLAKDAYSTSTSYVDSNYRKKWDDALRMFQSRHPSDSKYNTESYKHRSKIFRPKTRSLVRKHEASVAAAFFSNIDVISTEPVNQDDPQQAASAALMKEILQYRLTKTVPWFRLVCGAMQDAMTIGVVCSYQYWKYQETKDQEYTEVQDEFGNVSYQEVITSTVTEDEPCVELMPIENVRFDPGADWVNPVKSSPYVIRMIPMYVCDVKSMMNTEGRDGKSWKKYTDGEIRSAMKQENDQTKQTRDNGRQSTTDTGNAPITDYEIVWVHENFFRIDGKEKVFFTLGVEFMLTDPVDLKEVYFHGERPVVIGTCVIETHKAMPDSPVTFSDQLQREVNEIANQRIDNVKMVLNKRYIVKRGAQVDLKSIVRNVPASITLANDPVGDVRTIDFNDVTGSSYQEQDRLNVDYDELTGNFSQGSVMTNRKMGETVGGMGMISNAANQITEYTIRTFTETWVEPVIRQLVKLEQKYETDKVILGIAANKAQLLQKYGIDQVTDELLNQELTLNVNVGMGATDPIMRLNKFVGALTAFANSSQIPGINKEEVGKEIFGLAGYRDGARFIADEDSIPDEAKAAMQQAQEHIQQQDQMLQQQAQELEAAKQAANTAQADIILKERNAAVAEYKAETERFKDVLPNMNEQEIQAIVMKTIQDMMNQGQGAA